EYGIRDDLVTGVQTCALPISWVADERFWYRITTPEGSEFLLVEAAKGTRAPVFDHAKLAAALSTATGTSYDAHRLPFTDFDLSRSEERRVGKEGCWWLCA